MLVAFVSLRVFTLGHRDDQPHVSNLSEIYLRYITKATNQAPHLEFFTIQSYYYDDDDAVSDDQAVGDDYTFCCKRVNANWVVCEEAEYPTP